jgi:hypothetical protein
VRAVAREARTPGPHSAPRAGAAPTHATAPLCPLPRRTARPRSLLGLLAFTAPYLPWALLGFSLLLGNDVTSDLLGIAVGHGYYFLADVYPSLAAARGWRWRKAMHTPWLL